MHSKVRTLKNFAHLALGVTAGAVHLFPSRKLIVIGVTGTDGKTTTSSLICHILKESGKKVAVISTIGAVIDRHEYETGFHVTTPSPFSIQKYLKIAKNKGCTHAVLEVTSHALDQHRVWGIRFAIGVLTNITHEHLDYHKSYEKYVAAKLRLFQYSDKAVINSNGEWMDQVLKTIPKSKIVTYSLSGSGDSKITLRSLPFKIKTDLIGEFNLENILAASTACLELGVDAHDIEKAVASFQPPVGRQEIIKEDGPTVMVDFAHTANSFERILPEIRKKSAGRIIHVFGAAGERDSGKRPEMGKAASFFDDTVILTSEDPRGEDVRQINSQIKKGFGHEFKLKDISDEDSNKTIYEIDDRKKAIEYALSIAKKNDTVIITGKGHEKTINYGDGEVPWSDQTVVREFFKKK